MTTPTQVKLTREEVENIWMHASVQAGTALVTAFEDTDEDDEAAMKVILSAYVQSLRDARNKFIRQLADTNTN